VANYTNADIQAFWRLKQTAETGQAKAQYNLGLMYANGVGVEQDVERALHWYHKAANQGYSPAQYILAGKYANGQGLNRDLKQALTWYLKASERGNSRALFKLGQMLSVPQDELAQNCYRQAAEKGVVEAQVMVAASVAAATPDAADQGQAFAWYQKAAESGLPSAQYIVGTYFESGKAGPADLQQAIAWYRKAARQGFAPAQTQLGLMYLRGDGVPKDNKQAFSWIARAAEQGDAEACHQLGLMYERGVGVAVDPLLAESNYLKAAEHGDVRAQLRLAALCAVDRATLAADWYERAAANGNSQAKLQLGRIFAHGTGVEADLEKALALLLAAAEDGEPEAWLELARLLDGEAETLTTAWYQRAAEDGQAEAQYALAMRLDQGHGVARNQDLALYWFEKAAEAGIPEAQYWFGKLLVQLETEASLPEAISHFRKAAKHGLAAAQAELGELYARGEGVTKDSRQAASWFLKAAEQGDAEAQFALGELFSQGNSQGAAIKHAEQWYRRAVDSGGDDRALLALASLYGRTGHAAAEDWLRLAAARGMASAQLQLGDLLLHKPGGAYVPEALTCYIKAAAQDNADALRILARFSSAQPQALARALQRLAIDAGAAAFELHEGAKPAIQPSPAAQEPPAVAASRPPSAPAAAGEAGLDDYLAAAQQGDPRAQWHLGEVHAKGLLGQPRNAELARHWYGQAAQAGFLAAQATLALLLSTGQGGPQDDQQAVYWWRQAAEQGDPEAQYNLALMYEKGQGVAQDFTAASHWLRQAAEQGIGIAQVRLGLSCVMGSTGDPDLIEAYAWFAIAAAPGNSEAALANRRHAETLMSPAQLKEAKRRVGELLAIIGQHSRPTAN